jgi:hypothetical protein
MVAFVSKFLMFANSLILLFLSALHFYWASGGKWGIAASIPTTTDGKMIFHPGVFATIVVGIGLFCFAAIMAANLGLFNLWISAKYVRSLVLLIAVIFLLRAVGDFKFVGFTKKVADTPFAINDTKIYSPLCLFIGSSSLVIVLL